MLDELTQCCRCSIGGHRQPQGNFLPVAAQQARIDSVGLGQQALCIGEGTHTPRLHHAHLDAGREQLGDDDLLVASTGFADYPRGAQKFEFLDKSGTCLRSVRDAPFGSIVDTVIELVLGDIQANVVGFGFCRHGLLLLAIRAQGSISGSS